MDGYGLFNEFLVVYIGLVAYLGLVSCLGLVACIGLVAYLGLVLCLETAPYLGLVVLPPTSYLELVAHLQIVVWPLGRLNQAVK